MRDKLRTKIIVTIGPASAKEEIITSLINEGVSGFRINFAHGNPKMWEHFVNLVRRAEEKTKELITLIGDLRGPSIRLGILDSELAVKTGDVLKIIPSEKASSNRKEIPLPNKDVYEGLEIGDIIVLDDGRVRLKVSNITSNHVEVTALTDGIISSRKAIVIQNKEFELPPLTSYDIQVLEFIVKHEFNYVGLSYVRNKHDVEVVKREIMRYGYDNVKVIAKIETKTAVQNIDEIMDVSDSILIARGDLGMNYGLEEVPIVQKFIVNKALRRGVPVIIATQLLETLTYNPVPTRSEVADVYEAVMECVDALMLTDETSVGKYPILAVKWLKKIIMKAEKEISYRKAEVVPETLKSRFAKGVTELAENLKAKLLIYTMKGTTAFEIAKFRPQVYVYVGTNDENVIRLINILWGINPYLVKAENYEKGLERLLTLLKEKGVLVVGDIVIQTYGLKDEDLHIIKLRVVR